MAIIGANHEFRFVNAAWETLFGLRMLGATFSLNSNWRLIDWRRFSGTRWGVAKLVRRLTLDQVILGSNPSAPAIAFERGTSRAARPAIRIAHQPDEGRWAPDVDAGFGK
jgi:hypothetical protein